MMNCLRFMESSRTRNSILDWLLAATLAFAAISSVAGIDFEMGGVPFRSHSAWRALVLSAIVVAIRRWMGIDSLPRWLTRVALLAAICGSVLTWLRFLVTTIGGADSYGYVSASQLLAQGSFVAGRRLPTGCRPRIWRWHHRSGGRHRLTAPVSLRRIRSVCLP
jgi:hypothetical protein